METSEKVAQKWVESPQYHPKSTSGLCNDEGLYTTPKTAVRMEAKGCIAGCERLMGNPQLRHRCLGSSFWESWCTTRKVETAQIPLIMCCIFVWMAAETVSKHLETKNPYIHCLTCPLAAFKHQKLKFILRTDLPVLIHSFMDHDHCTKNESRV